MVAAATWGGSSFVRPLRSLAQAPVLGPLLAPWSGDHGGFPRFDQVKIADFKDALSRGIDLKRAEIKSITSQGIAPNFENSIAAYEDCGRPFNRTNRFFEIFTSTMNDKTMQSIESEMTPVLAKFDDEIIQNDPLFQRIKAVYEGRGSSGLTGEQQRLVEVYYRQFTRQGAGLDEKKKKRLREINERLATLFTDFGTTS